MAAALCFQTCFCAGTGHLLGLTGQYCQRPMRLQQCLWWPGVARTALRRSAECQVIFPSCDLMLILYMCTFTRCADHLSCSEFVTLPSHLCLCLVQCLPTQEFCIRHAWLVSCKGDRFVVHLKLLFKTAIKMLIIALLCLYTAWNPIQLMRSRSC